MIKIWAESARFQASQRHADLEIRILKKSWFSDFEILKICEQVSCEEYAQEEPPL